MKISYRVNRVWTLKAGLKIGSDLHHLRRLPFDRCSLKSPTELYDQPLPLLRDLPYHCLTDSSSNHLSLFLKLLRRSFFVCRPDSTMVLNCRWSLVFCCGDLQCIQDVAIHCRGSQTRPHRLQRIHLDSRPCKRKILLRQALAVSLRIWETRWVSSA